MANTEELNNLDTYKNKLKKVSYDHEYWDYLPYIDEDLNILGVHERKRIHDEQDPLLHATVLLLVVQIGKPRLLITDKTAKVQHLPEELAEALFASQVKAESTGRMSFLWDCPGGHVEYQDIYGVDCINKKSFKNCADREAKEELTMPVENKTPFCMYTLNYFGETKGDGKNKEIRKV